MGREAFLQQIKQQLIAGESLALTALQGLPGVGKTALAVTVAIDHEVQERFPDGILWAGLGPQPNVSALLTRWGSLLGIEPADVEEATNWSAWGRALSATIGNRRMLLIIDDAWQAEHALALQVGGPRCAHLLTTRLPQVAFTFAQQGVLQVPELAEDDALALLARYVPQLVQEQQQQALKLIQAVGCLPLAITLVGKYLAMQSFTGQPRRLRTALTQLHDAGQRLSVSIPTIPRDRSPHLPADTPLSLHATIAVSDQYLDAQTHATLCALSVFPSKPNCFSEEAALAVSQQPVETLDTLWDAGLLESNEEGRYTLHQTIADYAQVQNQDATAQQRLVSYIIPFVQQHVQDYATLEREMSNILAALDVAATLGNYQDLQRGVIALVPFMRIRGLYTLADQYLQTVLQLIPASEHQREQATILSQLAAFAELRSDYQQTESYAQRVLALTQENEQPDVVSNALMTLGSVAFERGTFPQSQSFYEQALALARQQDDYERICQLLGNLGQVNRRQGYYTQASEQLQEGLELARQHNNHEQMSMLLVYLCWVARDLSNITEAEQYLQKAFTIARQLGHRYILGRLSHLASDIALQRGQYQLAESYGQDALTYARQIGNRLRICQALICVGTSAGEQKNYAVAQHYLQESLDLARQLGARSVLTSCLMNLGELTGLQGDYAQANIYFQEGVELARALGAVKSLGYALMEWGNLYLRNQNTEAAATAFQEVLTVSQNLEIIAIAQYGLAQVAAQHGEMAEAIRLGQEALAKLADTGHHKAEEIRTWLQALSARSETEQRQA